MLIYITLISQFIPPHKEDVVHIYNGILLSYKEERNCAICRDVDGSRDCHSEWSRFKGAKQMCINTYMCNLEK